MSQHLVLQEQNLNITMQYQGKLGYKGYESPLTFFTHTLKIRDSQTDKEVNKDVAVGGALPVTNIFGLKIPTIIINSFFDMHIDDLINVLLPSMADTRIPGCNTVKNIFLVGSILTVLENGNGIFSEMPVGSKWYVKKYRYMRNSQAPDRGAYTLNLMRWYK